MSLINSSFHTIVTLATVAVLGMAWNIVISRTIGPQGVGILAVATLWSTLLFTVGNMTFGLSTVYLIGERKHKLGNIAANSLIMGVVPGIVLYLVAVAVTMAIGDALFGNVEPIYLYLAFAIAPLNMIMYQMMAVLQGMGRIDSFNLTYVSRSSSAILLLAILMILTASNIITVSSHGILLVLMVIVSSFTFTAVLSIYLVRRQIRGKWIVNWELLWETLKSSSKIHIATITTFIYGQAGVLIANHYLPPSDIGYLYTAMILTQFVVLVPQAVQIVLYAKMAGTIGKESEELNAVVCRNTIFAVVVVSIVLAAVSAVFVEILLGDDFAPTVPLLLILLPGVVAASVSQIVAALWVKKQWLWQITLSGVFMSVAGVALQTVLISRLGITGSAIANSLTYMVGFGIVASAHYLFISKHVREMLIIQRSDIVMYWRLWAKAKDVVVTGARLLKRRLLHA